MDMENQNSTRLSRVLIVDDDQGILHLARRGLQRIGCEADSAATGEQALAKLKETSYELLLLDYLLPDMDAKELIDNLNRMENPTPFLIMSGHGNEKIAVDFMKLGARDYIVKEYRLAELLPAVVRQVLDQLEMERKLATAQETIATQENLYQTLIETVPHPIWLADADGKVTFISKAWQKLTGVPAEKSLEMRWKETVHPDDVTRVRSRLHETRKRGKSCQLEFRLRGEDGSYRIVLYIATPVRNHENQIINWVGIFTDVTEAREMLNRLSEKTDELERSNKELEEFAYVASHDLQEPLRKVANFSQLLAKRYKGQLDERADEFIGYIVGGAVRMQNLITALLQYSRVGREQIEQQEMDLNAVLEDAKSVLELQIEENQATIKSTKLPKVSGHKQLMQQVLQNLIGNALKYRSKEPPLVNISAKKEGNCWQIEVRDNGMGFEQQYAERIFQIFQRLHTQSELPGTGFGLTICKKIVERHGGKIWVESQPGVGSSFYFTLPIEKWVDCNSKLA